MLQYVPINSVGGTLPTSSRFLFNAVKLWGAILQKNYSEGAWFQFSLFISFLPIKHQNVSPLTTNRSMDTTGSRGELRVGGVGRGGVRVGGCWRGGGGRHGGKRREGEERTEEEAWWNSHIILQQLIAIRRASAIFSSFLSYSPDPPRND